MKPLPTEIIIKDGAFALDGGSTFLVGCDSKGEEIRIELAWSIDQQICGKGQLSINGVEIAKRSKDEEHVLRLLSSAQYEEKAQTEDTGQVKNRIILGADINRIVNGIEHGCGLQAITDELIRNVRSDIYINGCPQQDVQRTENLEKANIAFRLKQWDQVVDLLKGYENSLSKTQKLKLEYAMKKMPT